MMRPRSKSWRDNHLENKHILVYLIFTSLISIEKICKFPLHGREGYKLPLVCVDVVAAPGLVTPPGLPLQQVAQLVLLHLVSQYRADLDYDYDYTMTMTNYDFDDYDD